MVHFCGTNVEVFSEEYFVMLILSWVLPLLYGGEANALGS